jgi:hypothetical protein
MVGAIPSFKTAAAAEGCSTLHEGESWPKLLIRLDETVMYAVVGNRIINELHS